VILVPGVRAINVPLAGLGEYPGRVVVVVIVGLVIGWLGGAARPTWWNSGSAWASDVGEPCGGEQRCYGL
jgi:hypothetical protein